MKIIKGNIFTTKCQTIVNTVNCVGVMGAGIAYECRLRYPEMYLKYVQFCNNRMINIGSLWVYKGDTKWILNFPTKFHWKYDSKPEYLEKGLEKFIATYKEKKITSIAFPLLGSLNGGISPETSLNIMKSYLAECKIPIEVYQHDPAAYDDLFLNFKIRWNSFSETELSKKIALRKDLVNKVSMAIQSDEIKNLSQLLSVKGIGEVALEKCFHFINQNNHLE